MTATAINLTANSNADLLDKVYTFLTTDADLVSAGEAWVSMEYTAGDSFILKGVGMGGTDEIYVGWRIVNNVGNDIYNIDIAGFTGYTNGVGWESQPQKTPTVVYMMSYNLPISYWLIANGRRFIVLTKVATVYTSCYCGFINSYSSPTQHPYPLLISATSDRMQRWSATTYISHAGAPVSKAAYFYTSTGWVDTYSTNLNGAVTSTPYIGIYPTNNSAFITKVRNDVDGGYSIHPCILASYSQYKSIFGEMDGFAWVSGFQQIAENTILIDGDTWFDYAEYV